MHLVSVYDYIEVEPIFNHPTYPLILGVNIGAAFITWHRLLSSRATHGPGHRQGHARWFAAIAVFAFLICALISVACNIRFAELTWIDYRGYPGGPLAFLFEQQAVTVDTVANAAGTIAAALADALMVILCNLSSACKYLPYRNIFSYIDAL